MKHVKAFSAAVTMALFGLGACATGMGSSGHSTRGADQDAAAANPNRVGSNQPGGASASPDGGTGGPATSGTVGPTPTSPR